MKNLIFFIFFLGVIVAGYFFLFQDNTPTNTPSINLDTTKVSMEIYIDDDCGDTDYSVFMANLKSSLSGNNSDGETVEILETMLTWVDDVVIDFCTEGTYRLLVSFPDTDGFPITRTLRFLVTFDNIPPEITIIENDTVFEFGDTEPDWTTYFTVYDGYDGDITVDSSMISYEYSTWGDLGNFNITITASDANGNVATDSINIRMEDNVPPSDTLFNVIGSDSSSVADGGLTNKVNLSIGCIDDIDIDTAYYSIDGGSNTSFTCASPATSSAEGTYTVTLQDKAGNTTSMSFVVDTTPPLSSFIHVNGVTSGDLTDGDMVSESVIFIVDSNSDIANAYVTLDGYPFSINFNEEYMFNYGDGGVAGEYTIVIEDLAGNQTTFTFTIV